MQVGIGSSIQWKKRKIYKDNCSKPQHFISNKEHKERFVNQIKYYQGII